MYIYIYSFEDCIVLHKIFSVTFFVNPMMIIQLVPFQVFHIIFRDEIHVVRLLQDNIFC